MDSTTTNSRERVAVAPSAELAAANEDTAPRSLKARLAAIRDDCDAIQKSNISKEKDGKKWTERGHIVEAILAEWRPLLTTHGVLMTPNLVERAYTGNRCDVIVDFLFERTDDSDEARTIRWAGAGTDNGDKAFAKAGTNALKEMIKKVFLVTDLDDAKEETETVEHQTPDQASKAQVEVEREKAKKSTLAWASTFKKALETAPSIADIDRLKRDNREALDSPDVSEVMRTFFNDLIADRKAELADGFPGDK